MGEMLEPRPVGAECRVLSVGVIDLAINGLRDKHMPTASHRANRSPDPSELQNFVRRKEQSRCVWRPRNSPT